MMQTMKSSRIDLVILDITMPGEDGLSLCRRLRVAGTTPIILLTAMGTEIDRIDGLEMGADGNSTGILLRKVIDRSRLSTSQRVDGTGRRHSLSRRRHSRGGRRGGHRGIAGR